MKTKSCLWRALTFLILAISFPANGWSTALDAAANHGARLVVGQLQTAIYARDERGTALPWSSQPGALRSFSHSTGSLQRLYKLYSAPQLTTADATSLAADVPANWSSKPGQYVDLNAPLADPMGGLIYPIADPRSDAEGFSFTPTADGNPLPMPVAWLYICQDGTMGSLDDSNRFVATLAGRSGVVRPAGADNPLVARVAFWTDDTTCKININTASEGVFWDSLRCDTTEERHYAKYQPARGEWQRDMGHPAAVCLSSVLFPGKRYHLPGTTSRLEALDLDEARQLWRVAPGIPDAGSRGGTEIVSGLAESIVSETIDRLMASTGEIAESRNLDEATRGRAEQGQFFLTAHSRGPDITIAGTPRISIWPIPHDTYQALAERRGPGAADSFTEFDALAAAVSAQRSGEQPHRAYSVQRQDAQFQHTDLYGLHAGRNHVLFVFLNRTDTTRWKALIGSGLSPLSFAEKFDASIYGDATAIAASALNYIRETNPLDPILPAEQQFARARGADGVTGKGQVVPMNFSGGATAHANTWFFATLPRPRGLGRFPTVSEVALIVTLRAEKSAQDVWTGAPTARARAQALTGIKVSEYDVGLLIEGFCPSHAWPPIYPDCSFLLAGFGARELARPYRAGAQNLTIWNATMNGRPLIFDVDITGATIGSITRSNLTRPPTDWPAWGGTLGPRFLALPIRFQSLVLAGDETRTLSFSGSISSIEHPRLLVFYDAEGPGELATGNFNDASPLVQSIPLPWPSMQNLPLPDQLSLPIEQLLETARSDVNGAVFSNAIVHSLVPNHSDYRLVAAKRHVIQFHQSTDSRAYPTFVTHFDYGRSPAAHFLREPGRSRQAIWDGVPMRTASFFEDLGMGSGSPDYPSRAFHFGLVRLIKDFNQFGLSRGALLGGREASMPGREVFQITRFDRDGTQHRRREARPDITGDFDNGLGPAPDGPYINAPDGGDIRALAHGATPYFEHLSDPWMDNPGTFSPYRHVPSPAMFGSMPTGVQLNVPWQTLLFRPDPNKATAMRHFGSDGVPDRVFLDFFRMPIVQPSTAIDWAQLERTWTASDAFSTEGRINLNYQIVPFTHIRRATALHAVLKAQKLLAIPDSAAATYKTGAGDQPWRHFIDAEQTLRQWEAKFESGEVFRHPSEICEQWLVPEGETLENMPSFWAAHRLTGDNTKERPYANIYPHLTTRSNTFEVHVIAETIAHAEASAPDQFTPGIDFITGHTQRKITVEARIDPQDPRLPDFAALVANNEMYPSLESFAVVSGGGLDELPAHVEIAEFSYDAELRVVHLRWRSRLGQFVEVETSSDLVKWSSLGVYLTGAPPSESADEGLFAVGLGFGTHFFRLRTVGASR
ncbi:MAG: Verru_Chthon cassette protein A [Verrucomicrobiales bacterium]